MDVYGLSTTDLFRIDDLLDFTNEDGLFSSDDATANSDLDLQHHHIPPPEYPCNNSHFSTSSSSSPSAAVSDAPLPSSSTDFTDDFYVPNDDKAELEWLSKFVDDSFTDLPANELTGARTSRPDTSFSCRTRRKRSEAVTMTKIWTLSSEPETPTIGKSKTISINLNTKNNDTTYSAPTIAVERPSSSSPPVGVRRCTHCASEKTPQWRTGPLGPKTLCNACGVRYKSGRLVPEYRPAASPTFVLTQHSNSHRKVMELRRQKETHVLQSDEQMQQRQVYHHHHDFQVC